MTRPGFDFTSCSSSHEETGWFLVKYRNEDIGMEYEREYIVKSVSEGKAVTTNSQ
jgi:hypothetical protein